MTSRCCGTPSPWSSYGSGPGADVPAWATAATLFSVTATATETSLVCGAAGVPRKAPSEGPYLAFSVAGTLDHALVGVLSGLLAPLADAAVPVFTLSTFDTDWVLVPRRPRRPRRAHLAGGRVRRAPGRRRPTTRRRSSSEHHPPRRVPCSRCLGRAQEHRRQGPRPGRQRRPPVRLRQRLHRQPLQGQPGAVEPGGRQGRRRARGGAQLRRRQLLHRRRGLPDHPRGRRAGRARPRRRRHRRGGVLHRADRPDEPAAEPPRRRRRRRRGAQRRPAATTPRPRS